jgi:3-oxoacyl-[acyl-carrier-protein] synthase III
MTSVVAFELPVAEEAVLQHLEEEAIDEARIDEVIPKALDPALTAALAQELAGTEYGLFAADSGRGASGYAVALEVLSIVANFGGATATIAGGIALTSRLYRWLQQRLSQRVKVSLGAACFLAAAHLADRLGQVEFRLHGAGDTRNRPHDFAYTGNDCFYVIFERRLDLFFYAVDAYGDVTPLGEAKIPPLEG